TWHSALGTDMSLLLGRPAVLVHLPSSRDAERAGRNVLGDRRSRRDVGALANRHGGDKRRVASDERAVLDDGRVLLRPVVVTGDDAGADVDAVADGRVAEVRQVVRLRPRAERRLL